MKSKISLFNKSLIKSNIKRFWWVSALYFLGLTIIYPLRFLQSTYQEYDYSLLISTAKFHSYFILIIPVLIGVLMFQYIHKHKAITMFHSLPTSKTMLFVNQTISGLMLMLTPVILNGVILIILRLSIKNIMYLCNIPDVLIFTGLIILLEILIFSSTIFVGMLTGTSISHFIFVYAFYFIPIAVYSAAKSFLSYMLTGFVGNIDTIFSNNIILNIPLLNDSSLYKFENKIYNGPAGYHYVQKEYIVDLSTIQLIVYLCVTLLFIVTAIFLYKKIKLETTTDIISFNVIRPIFKYGITFAFMLIGSISIMEFLQYKTNIPLLLICSLVGYCIAQILLQKSFIIWRSYKGFLVYSAIIVVMFLVISNDLIGFVNRVPNVNDVESVYIGDYNSYENPQYYHSSNTKMSYIGTTFTEPTNIENVEKMHKIYLEETEKKLKDNNRNTYYPSIYLVYILKNGSKLVRGYMSEDYNLNSPKSQSDLQLLMSSKEYIIKNNTIIYQNPEAIERVLVNGKIQITDKDQITQLIPLIREDIINFADTNYDNLPTIEITCKEKVDSIGTIGTTGITYWLPSEGKIATWLQEHS